MKTTLWPTVHEGITEGDNQQNESMSRLVLERGRDQRDKRLNVMRWSSRTRKTADALGEAPMRRWGVMNLEIERY